jgi:nitrogen fixation-related uncharacterized protein
MALISAALFLPGLPLAFGAVEPDELGSGMGRFNSIICEDLDIDGRMEIVVGSYEGYVTSIEHNAGDYSVVWRSQRYGTRCWGVEAGQFDDDEQPELAIGDGDGDVRVLDGKSKKEEWRAAKVDRDAHGLNFHDTDGDGANELLVGTGFKTDQGWGQVYFFKPNGSEPVRTLPDPWNSRLRELHIADVDNDREGELIVCSGAALGDVPGEGYFRVYDLRTLEVEFESEDLGGCVEGFKVTDLDGDGTLDIILSTGYRYREGWLYVYQWDGAEYSRTFKSGNIGPKAYGLDVADIDGDDIPEMVVSNMDGRIRVFDGRTFQLEWTSSDLGRDILGLVIADVDGDGQLEIITGQGGYIGKGDYTSGYVPPHIYIMDGRTKAMEAVLGAVDSTVQWLKAGILALVLLGLVQLAILFRLVLKGRKLKGGRH